MELTGTGAIGGNRHPSHRDAVPWTAIPWHHHSSPTVSNSAGTFSTGTSGRLPWDERMKPPPLPGVRKAWRLGRLAAVVARGRACAAGRSQVSWRGALGTGVYLLRATATTEDGTSVQAVRPVVVVR